MCSKLRLGFLCIFLIRKLMNTDGEDDLINHNQQSLQQMFDK